jgi:ATP-binding cassette subfamily F protein uup
MSAPNVLILDEPTNDLDVQTLSILEDYLEEFNGCVITVSHDRYFLDRTVNQIFSFSDGGEIKFYPGNYSTYLDYKEAEAVKAASTEKTSHKKEPAPAPVNGHQKKQKTDKPRRLSNWERRELEDLETKIPELEAEKTELEKALDQTPPQQYSELQKLSEQVATLEQNIEDATARWLELAELES